MSRGSRFKAMRDERRHVRAAQTREDRPIGPQGEVWIVDPLTRELLEKIDERVVDKTTPKP